MKDRKMESIKELCASGRQSGENGKEAKMLEISNLT